MDRRQLFDCKCVCARDRQFHVAYIEEIATEHVWVYLEIVAIQTTLDDDLPEARDAEKRCTGGILDERTGAGGQLGRTGCRPKKQACVGSNFMRHPRTACRFQCPIAGPAPFLGFVIHTSAASAPNMKADSRKKSLVAIMKPCCVTSWLSCALAVWPTMPSCDRAPW